ncbi:MAG: hypothetical protein LIO77_08165 [Rikenellaceae bacterium]|nr:hypothetical protein [Rikenellaceae bacterium]
MNKIYTPAERLKHLLLTYGLKSLRQLSREIGLHSAESLYQINRGNNRISSAMAERISTRFPAVDYSFLLTGVMSDPAAIKVPLYIADPAGRYLDGMHPDSYVFMPYPNTKTVAFATVNMEYEPIIGVFEHSILIVDELWDGIPVKGRPYLVQTKDYTMLRYITPDKDPGRFRLSSTPRLSIHDTYLPIQVVVNIFPPKIRIAILLSYKPSNFLMRRD